MSSARLGLWLSCLVIGLSAGQSLVWPLHETYGYRVPYALGGSIVLPLLLAAAARRWRAIGHPGVVLFLFVVAYLFNAGVAGPNGGQGELLLLSLTSFGVLRLSDARVQTSIALGSGILPPLLLCLKPHWTQLLLVPPGLMLAVINFVMLHGDRLRERYRRVIRDAPGPGSRQARQRLAWSLAGVVLVGSTFILVLRTLSWSEWNEDPAELTSMEEPAEPEAEEKDPSTEELANSAEEEVLVSDLNLGNRGAAVSDDPALYVSVLEGPPAGERESFYLRGRVLDTFTTTGMTLGAPVPSWRFDEQDGRGDGWVQLRKGIAKAPRTLEIIHASPFRLSEDAGEIAFLPDRTLAVEGPRARFGEDSFCTLDARIVGGKRYRLRYDMDFSSWSSISRRPALRDDSRFLQLPEDSASLRAIQQLAEEWIPRSGTDYQRIATLVRFLRTEFEYEVVGTGFSGTAGLLAFLQRRTGYCSYFASSAVLMLRSQGIPARVVTGFVARERAVPGDSWLVRRRHAHAWIEVPFEGVGWVSFDPTARATGRGDADALGNPPPTGWLGELRLWADGEQDFGQLIGHLVLGSYREASRHPSLLLLGMAGLLALLAYARRPLPSAVPRGRLPRQEAQLFDRLMKHLAGRGHRGAAGQSALSLGREIAQREGARYAGLPAMIEQFYAAAFGGRGLQASELQHLEKRITAWEEAETTNPEPSSQA